MDRLAHVLKWQEKNPPHLQPAHLAEKRQLNTTANSYMKERRKRDPAFRILCCLRSRVKSAVKAQGTRKHAKTLNLLGCDTGHLKRHLESLWLPGMCWENYGEWHIDHIRPCASFDLLDPAQQRACFHWSNLQPLWAMDNFRKNDQWAAPVPDGALTVIWSTQVG